MTDLDFLRSCLEDLLADTRNTVPVGSFWIGDAAAERRANDNLRSGALAFRTAHGHARRGLEALEAGDLKLAEEYLREGKNLLLEAVARQLPPAGLEQLRSGAKARGRRKTTDDRNVALAKAVANQQARGLSGAAARQAAIFGDAELKTAFSGKGDACVRQALRNGKLKLASEKKS